MVNRYKYSIQMNIALDEQLNRRIMSQCLEDAMLLYQAKTGQKFRVATLSVYDDTMKNIALPDFRKEDIGDAPTVDAVEAVHGQWVDKEDYYTETGMTCSVCCERYWLETDRTDFKPYNYCPNCGAKMNGGTV